jgi:hypothetical protein
MTACRERAKSYLGGGWALGLPVKECLRQALNGAADWLLRRGWRSAGTLARVAGRASI